MFINFDIENFVWKTCEVEKGSIILLFFPAGVLLMLVGEGWCGLFYASVCSYKFHALAVYLHFTFTVPPIGGASGIQPNICGGAFLKK